MLDLKHAVHCAFAGFHHDLRGERSIGANAQTDHQQASRHNRGKQLPRTHKITSIVTIRKAIPAAASVQ
jgi:hypothetical protein